MTSFNTTFTSFRDAYDAAGRRRQRVHFDGLMTAVTTWTYDASAQLTQERRHDGFSSAVTTYVYDPVGNRKVLKDASRVVTSTYDAANRLHHALEGSDRATYTYDPNGNQRTIEMPSGDLTTHTWSYENQLRSVEDPLGEVVTYTYAPVNKVSDEFRFSKETDLGITLYVWDNRNIILEFDDLGMTVAEYTAAPRAYGELVSEYQESDADSRFYHFDPLGSTAALTDPSQVPTDSYLYGPFGDVLASPGTSTNPYQWVGQVGYYRDEDTGIYSLRNRDYKSSEGRFLSADPLGFDAGDENFYRYAENDVINRSDPSGLGDPPRYVLPLQYNDTRKCHTQPDRRTSDLPLTDLFPKTQKATENFDNEVDILETQFDPKVLLSKKTVDKLIAIGKATLVPRGGTRPQEVIVIELPTATGIIKHLVYKRNDRTYSYAAGVGHSAPIWEFYDSYSYVGATPSTVPPKEAADCIVFSPDEAAKSHLSQVELDFFVRVTPFLGTADRIAELRSGREQDTAFNRFETGMSAANDLLIIGGVVCRAAVTVNEIRILRAVAVSGGMLAVPNVALSVNAARNAESTSEAAIHGVNAVLNLLIMANAIKLVRVRRERIGPKRAGSAPNNTKVDLESFDDIVKNPASLWGKSADEVAAILGDGWTRDVYARTGSGWRFTKGDKTVFYHTDGLHKGQYWGYTSGVTGKVKLVGCDYVATPGDNAKIIHISTIIPD